MGIEQGCKQPIINQYANCSTCRIINLIERRKMKIHRIDNIAKRPSSYYGMAFAVHIGTICWAQLMDGKNKAIYWAPFNLSPEDLLDRFPTAKTLWERGMHGKPRSGLSLQGKI